MPGPRTERGRVTDEKKKTTTPQPGVKGGKMPEEKDAS